MRALRVTRSRCARCGCLARGVRTCCMALSPLCFHPLCVSHVVRMCCLEALRRQTKGCTERGRPRCGAKPMREPKSPTQGAKPGRGNSDVEAWMITPIQPIPTPFRVPQHLPRRFEGLRVAVDLPRQSVAGHPKLTLEPLGCNPLRFLPTHHPNPPLMLRRSIKPANSRTVILL